MRNRSESPSGGGVETFAQTERRPGVDLLNEPEKASERREKMETIISAIAARENGRLGEELISQAGRLRMEPFRRGRGGPYGKENEKTDERFVQEREIEWSGMDNPRVRNFLAREYGVDLAGKTEDEATRDLLDEWGSRRMEKDGPLAEVAVTALLARVLSERYLVVRTTEYDDYANGVDQMVINRRTGEVICAIDEVSEGETGALTATKDETIMAKLMSGGTTIKYGLTFRQGVLAKTPLEHAPIFRLAISRPELYELVESLPTNQDAPVSNIERRIFNQLIASLKKQREKMLSALLPSGVRARLEALGVEIESMNAQAIDAAR